MSLKDLLPVPGLETSKRQMLRLWGLCLVAVPTLESLILSLKCTLAGKRKQEVAWGEGRRTSHWKVLRSINSRT